RRIHFIRCLGGHESKVYILVLEGIEFLAQFKMLHILSHSGIAIVISSNYHSYIIKWRYYFKPAVWRSLIRKISECKNQFWFLCHDVLDSVLSIVITGPISDSSNVEVCKIRTAFRSIAYWDKNKQDR